VTPTPTGDRPRGTIGKLFHVTPLVDSIGDAEYFFNSVFSPLCMIRNYSPHWHRHGAVYVIADTSIEPMECLPPRDGEPATSWYRYVEKYGPRVHNLAFYTSDGAELAARLEAAGVRTTDAGAGGTVFAHPKDTPGMLEFFEVPAEPGYWVDPRFSPEWPAFRDDFWAGRHPLGVVRLSHITVVVHDRTEAARFFVDVLDAVPLPEQASRVDDADATFVLVGEDTVLELAQPRSDACPIARDLEVVGQGVTGITFQVRDIERALAYLEPRQSPVARRDVHELTFDLARTWGTEYRLTDRVLDGDLRG